jgi:OOP family OmpA-OmpF porin
VFRDTDGDGVIDLKDACPATPPGTEVDGHGCPLPKDSDRDGVSDANDRCPNTAPGERVDASGCPIPVAKEPAAAPAPKADVDSDGDGIPDSKDQCLNTPRGTPTDANGCPVIFKSPTERIVTLRGVTFAPWTSELTAASMRVLDDVAKQLVAAPTIRVEVAGHTDARGPKSRNITLSLARAESVRAYLVMRGVAAERIVARGYGPDQPIADNATVGGRAMNRRVELRRID